MVNKIWRIREGMSTACKKFKWFANRCSNTLSNVLGDASEEGFSTDVFVKREIWEEAYEKLESIVAEYDKLLTWEVKDLFQTSVINYKNKLWGKKGEKISFNIKHIELLWEAFKSLFAEYEDKIRELYNYCTNKKLNRYAFRSKIPSIFVKYVNGYVSEDQKTSENLKNKYIDLCKQRIDKEYEWVKNEGNKKWK